MCQYSFPAELKTEVYSSNTRGILYDGRFFQCTNFFFSEAIVVEKKKITKYVKSGKEVRDQPSVICLIFKIVFNDHFDLHWYWCVCKQKNLDHSKTLNYGSQFNGFGLRPRKSDKSRSYWIFFQCKLHMLIFSLYWFSFRSFWCN